MQIRSYVNGSVKVIVAEGDMNKLELKDLKDEFRFLPLFSEVALDLSGVAFAGTSLVNLLAYLQNRFPEDYRKIRLINPNEMIRQMLSLTHLDRLYPVVWQEEAFRAAS